MTQSPNPFEMLSGFMQNVEKFGRGLPEDLFPGAKSADINYVRADEIAPGMMLKVSDTESVKVTSVSLLGENAREFSMADGDVLIVPNNSKVQIDG